MPSQLHSDIRGLGMTAVHCRGEAPMLQRRLTEMDTIARHLPPAEFREDVADYMRFWSGLVDRMGLRVEG